MTSEIEDLKSRIERLERLTRHMDWVAPQPVVTTPSWARHCEVCGIDLNQSLGYVCANLRCPTGMGGAL